MPGRAAVWMRMTEAIGDDPVLQACALAYLSDDVPMDAVIALHPDHREPSSGDESPYDEFMSASLDHALWFHRPPQVDDWHLHDLTSHGYLSSRGLSVGHVLTADGTHIATIAQEVVLRHTKR